jgi:hypothetical protein
MGWLPGQFQANAPKLPGSRSQALQPHNDHESNDDEFDDEGADEGDDIEEDKFDYEHEGLVTNVGCSMPY